MPVCLVHYLGQNCSEASALVLKCNMVGLVSELIDDVNIFLPCTGRASWSGPEESAETAKYVKWFNW
jgi:hypothetical protein